MHEIVDPIVMHGCHCVNVRLLKIGMGLPIQMMHKKGGKPGHIGGSVHEVRLVEGNQTRWRGPLIESELSVEPNIAVSMQQP